MPQMSPLMWQAMFLTGIFLLVLSTTKIYFLEVSIEMKTAQDEMYSGKNKMWTW